MKQNKGRRRILSGLTTLLVMITLAACSSASTSSASPASTATPSSPTTPTTVSVSQMTLAVQQAQTIQSVPSDLTPSLTDTNDFPYAGPAYGPTKCYAPQPNSAGVPPLGFGECVYGDLTSNRLMIVYGDSHAVMWGAGLESIATRAGWRLETFYLSGCPAPDIDFISYQTNAPNTQCTKFHEIAPEAIKALHPNLIVVTSESNQQVSRGVPANSAQWQAGLVSTFKSLSGPGIRFIMIGDIPQWSGNDAACLAQHFNSVQTCAAPTGTAVLMNLQAEQAAAEISGAQYISTTPFICAAKCEPIINNIRVYFNNYHLTRTYVQFLSGPLQQAMGLPNA